MSESEPRLRRPGDQPLYKQNSWSRDILRDESWTNRRRNHRLRCVQSVTDDDLDELRACFELGFNFDSPDLDPKLSSTFPAMEFYYAVNRQYCDSLSRSSPATFSDSSTTDAFRRFRRLRWQLVSAVLVCGGGSFSICDFEVFMNPTKSRR